MTLYETIYKALKDRKTTDIKIGDREFTIEVNLFKDNVENVRLFVNDSFSYYGEYSCLVNREYISNSSYFKDMYDNIRHIFLYVMYAISYDTRSFKSEDEFNIHKYKKVLYKNCFVGWRKKAD